MDKYRVVLEVYGTFRDTVERVVEAPSETQAKEMCRDSMLDEWDLDVCKYDITDTDTYASIVDAKNNC